MTNSITEVQCREIWNKTERGGNVTGEGKQSILGTNATGVEVEDQEPVRDPAPLL